MDRLAFILRQKLPVIIFLFAAVIGGILIFWYVNAREDNNKVMEENPELSENISVKGNTDPELFIENTSLKDDSQFLSSSIPYGLRAISLPISFFGDISSIREGDRVDIISVFYDPDSNQLYSEVIIYGKEIIILKNNDHQSIGKYQDIGSSGYFGDEIFNDLPSGNDINKQLKKILVITFYLEVIEVEKAFMAIENGQLYLSLCPS